MIAPIKTAALVSALKAASLAMCDDPTRPQLCGILVEIVEGHVDIVASNGHWIAVWHEPIAGTVDSDGNARMLVPAADVKPLLAWLKGKPKEGNTYVDTAGTFEASCAKYTIVPLAHEFPPYREVLRACEPAPKVTAPRTVLLAGAYVADIVRAFKFCGDRPPCFRFGGELDPVWITAQWMPLTCVLMAVRA